MRRVIACVIILSAVMAHVAFAEEPVHFADANLKRAVEQALGQTNPTPTDMLALNYYLSAIGRGITNLAGIEYATNLQVLHLDLNQISDLSPLSGLTNLTELCLDNNQISDLSPLSGLTQLTRLELWGNQVTNLSSLAGLTNLQVLALGVNQISDLSSLTGLTNLWCLNIEQTQVRNLSPLAGLTNLTQLTLDNNQISDLSPLAGLMALDLLRLMGNQISDVSPLSGLTNLQRLLLQDNQISDISPLSGLTSLRELYLDNNQISYLLGFVAPTSVTYLSLYNNQISDISPLAGLHPCTVILKGNPLNSEACAVYIPLMLAKGVGVFYDPCVTKKRTLTLSSTVGGSVTTPGQGPFDYDEGTSVPITATTDTNYRFAGWTGTAANAGKVASPTSASTTVTVDADYTLVANFEPDTPPSEPVTPSLTVKVQDNVSLLPLEGATVSVGGLQVRTDARGICEVVGISPRIIDISASCPGFNTQTTLVSLQPGAMEVYFSLVPTNPVVISTQFTPCQNGFHFANDQAPGYCMGMVVTACYLFLLGRDHPTSDPQVNLLADGNPQVQKIKQLEGRYRISLATVCSVLSALPIVDSTFAENQYRRIRECIAGGVPCPVGITAGLTPGHAVLAYKICEYHIGDAKVHLLFVYNPNYPCPPNSDDQERIILIETDGVWKVNKYGSYDRFAVPDPFTKDFFTTEDGLLDLHNVVDDLSDFSVTLNSPATLVVTNPDGLTVDHDRSDVEGAYYHATDVDGDGHEEQVVFFLAPKPGTYTIEVIPDPNASPDATFSLVATRNGIDEVLADNVKIRDIPKEPYVFEVRAFQSDLDNSAAVDARDLGRIASWWLHGCSYPDWCDGADLDYSGRIDLKDYGVFASEWRQVGGNEDKAVAPVAWWTFDEGTGTVAKDSAGTSDGTVNGAKRVAGRIAGALRFNGIDDYVDCGSAQILAPEKMTVAFWVFVEGRTSYQYVLGKSRDMFSEQDYTFSTGGDGKLEFAFGQEPGKRVAVKSKEGLPLGQWVFVVGTRDGATASLYLNGQLENSAAYSFAVTDKGQSLRIGSIGQPEPEWAGFFKGKIDDVRIYDKALSAEEIQELYKQVSP
jgi:uncharacterized repeat protein (TIGR02543 family)